MLLAPLVGAGLGAATGGIGAAVRHGATALLGAAVTVALLAALTRGLHLDGLADTTDGLASYRPADDALQIMRQGTVGPLGVVALVLVLLVDVAALASVAHPVVATVLAAATGRCAALLACTPRTPPARPDGLGALVAGTVGERAAAVATAVVLLLGTGLALLVGTLGDGITAVVAMGCGLAAGQVLRGHAVRRLGGITGDVLGAQIELATATTLLVLAVS
jgi:adenosylcobinamide-GDP ribazoletransferase